MFEDDSVHQQPEGKLLAWNDKGDEQYNIKVYSEEDVDLSLFSKRLVYMKSAPATDEGSSLTCMDQLKRQQRIISYLSTKLKFFSQNK